MFFGIILKWIVENCAPTKDLEIGKVTSIPAKDAVVGVTAEAAGAQSLFANLFSDDLAKAKVESSSAGATYVSRPNLEN